MPRERPLRTLAVRVLPLAAGIFIVLAALRLSLDALDLDHTTFGFYASATAGGLAAALLLSWTGRAFAKAAGERRRVAEELDRIFTLSPGMLCIVGFDGFFKRVNPAFTQTLGYTAEELRSKHFVHFVYPADRARTMEVAERLVAEGQPISFENRYVCKDGSPCWIHWTATPVPREQLIYGAARDVTERKESEATIRELNERLQERVSELEALTKELEGFNRSASHDLRTPLTAVQGFVTILRKDYVHFLPDEGRRYLEIVSESADQMARLLEGLLTLARVGGRSLERKPVETKALVADALSQLSVDREKAAVELSVGELPQCNADPTLLRQVFVNLLSNALKYSRDRKPPRIEVGSYENGRPVWFVSDNGVGFRMDQADRLFRAFHRLDGGKEFEGTGVGLALVKQIVHRHGGRVWAESQEGEGATFYFTLGEEG